MAGAFFPLSFGDVVLNSRQQLYYSGTTVTYTALAAPGTPLTSTGWQIRKITRDSQGRTVSVEFAQGTLEYTAIAANYLSYSYS